MITLGVLASAILAALEDGGGPPPGGGAFGAHEYWRIKVTAVNSGSTVSIGEIEMRELPGEVDLCSGGTASADSVYVSYIAANAFDNNLTTRWSNNAALPAWIQYQFASPVEIGEVRIRAPDAGNYASAQMVKDFVLEYSDDGSTWTQAGEGIVGQPPMAASEQRTYWFVPQVSGEDPWFQFVSALLPMSTDFSDEIGNTWTPTGATVTGGVAVFDGVNDFLELAAALAFAYGRSNYTVEGFLKENGSASTQCFFDTRDATHAGIGIYNRAAGFSGGVTFGTNGALVAGSATQFSTSALQHWALIREDGVTRFHLAGVLLFSVTDTRLLSGAAGAFVGDNYLAPANQPAGVSAGGIRSTRAVARYRGGVTFTPPSGPFPTAGGTAPGTGPGAHRYWRLFISASENTSYHGVTEVQFYDRQLVLVSGYDGGSTGSITGSSSINGPNIDYNAFDGNLVNSGWISAAAGNQWVRQDMQGATAIGAPVEVRVLVIYGSWNAPDASPKDFKLQWSDDDSTWTDAASWTGETGWGSAEQRTFIVF